jgi:hypothetical protein
MEMKNENKKYIDAKLRRKNIPINNLWLKMELINYRIFTYLVIYRQAIAVILSLTFFLFLLEIEKF